VGLYPAIGAAVSKAFAAAIPLVGSALTDGTVTADEAGGIAAAPAGALVTVDYVTWQTVNKAKPSDAAALAQAAAAIPPIVLQAVDPTTVQYIGAPELPVDVTDGHAHGAEPSS